MDHQLQGTDKQLAEREYLRNGIPSIVLAIVTVVLSAYSFWVVQPNIRDRYRRICDANFEKLGLEPVGAFSRKVPDSGTEEVDAKDTGEGVGGSANLRALDTSATGGGTARQAVPTLVEEGRTARHAVRTLSADERKKLLVDTQLCLRRLAIMDQADDSVRFESAIVAQALADWYRDRAWEAAEADPRSGEIGSMLAGERSELGKAMDSMRAVQRLKGPLANQASVWMLEKQLREAAIDGGKELTELEASAREIEGAEPVLGRILAMRALRFGATEPMALATDVNVVSKQIGSGDGTDVDQKVVNTDGTKLGDSTDDLAGGSASASGSGGVKALGRVKMLEEAVGLLEKGGDGTLELDSWRALVRLPIDAERAQDLAWGAVQDFWSRKRSDRPRAEELDAVLRGLLVGGNLEEAQSFVVNQLKKLPSFEQTKFRQLVAASCLRQVVADYLIDERKGSKKLTPELNGKAKVARVTSDYTLLDLAVRLQPELDGLQEVIIAIGNSESEKSDGSLSSYVRRVIATSEREGLRGIGDAVRAAKNNDDDAITKAIERVCQDDMAYGVLATKVAMSMVQDETNRKAAIVWLKALNEYSPDVLAAWFARGNLHLKAGEKEPAIECFEYLAKRLPDNEQVKEMLEEAR